LEEKKLDEKKMIFISNWKQGTDAKDVHFYYTEKRNHVFESLMVNAEYIGKKEQKTKR